MEGCQVCPTGQCIDWVGHLSYLTPISCALVIVAIVFVVFVYCFFLLLLFSDWICCVRVSRGEDHSVLAGYISGLPDDRTLYKHKHTLAPMVLYYTLIESAVLTLLSVTHTIWGQYNTACVKLEPASAGLTLVSGAI